MNVLNGEKYKYIHLLWRNELKFNRPMVDLIDNPQNGFNAAEHVFITPHKEVYESLRTYNNVLWDGKSKNLFNEYADSCKWMIAHSLYSTRVTLGIKQKYMSKIIWRSWGGFTGGYRLKDHQLIRNTARRFINKIIVRKLNSFAAIGIANIVDVIEIRRVIKDTPLYRLSYAQRGGFDDILAAAQKPPRNDGYVNVLLGHRGGTEENHIHLLTLLDKFKNEHMRVYLPLSYGSSEYIEEVKEHIRTNQLTNVFILDEFIPFSQYVEFLHDMDIALLDGTSSYALGNIAVLLFYKKKFFLNREGIVTEAFDHEKIPYNCIDELENMDYLTFSKPVEYPDGVTEDMRSQDIEYSLKHWREFFADFD